MSKTLRYAVTALLAGLTLLLGAPAASASGGAIELEVTGDGADNVNVLVTWKKDDRPVTEIVAGTLTAKSKDGRSYGPVELRSSPEGQNLYHAAEALPTGEWKVTVKVSKPAKARKTFTAIAKDPAVVAAAATSPQDGSAGPAQGDAATPGKDGANASGQKDAAASGAAEDGGPLGTLLIIGVATLALAVGVVTWMRLGRRDGPA